MIIAADISMQLTALGYEISGISPRGEDALQSIEATPPDLALIDINLKGTIDGIETAQRIHDKFHIPFIFLTANSDDATFQRAKKTKPYAFITKPFQPTELERTIELVVEQLKEQNNISVEDHSYFLSDRIFVRHKDKVVKVFIQDILYAEADRNYCMVHTADTEYLLTVPLRILEENLPSESFVRTHRSYVVNLHKIDALTDNQGFLVLGQKQVPISKSYKEEVMKRLKVI